MGRKFKLSLRQLGKPSEGCWPSRLPPRLGRQRRACGHGAWIAPPFIQVLHIERFCCKIICKVYPTLLPTPALKKCTRAGCQTHDSSRAQVPGMTLVFAKRSHPATLALLFLTSGSKLAGFARLTPVVLADCRMLGRSVVRSYASHTIPRNI